MLKRINLAVLSVLLMTAVLQISASEETKISHELIFDSNEEQESELIQEVMELYHGLTKTVKKSSRAVIVRQSLEKFELTDHTKVFFESGTLHIVMGDGKGSVVKGDFHTIECTPEIETTSWILEQLGF